MGEVKGNKVEKNVRKKGGKKRMSKTILTSEFGGKVYELIVYTTTVAAKIIPTL